MQYGISFPNFGPDFHPRRLAELAHQAEDAGWDAFFLWDHLYFGPVPTADPWIALSAMAMATSQIRLGPLVTPLARRRVAKLARETASLDLLSNGRLILGVGLGGLDWEWQGFGEATDPKERAAILDESLDALVTLWSGQPTCHNSDYTQISPRLPGMEPGAVFLPTPLQQPRIPIWVAGAWPNKPPFRRAARWDGMAPIPANNPLETDLTPAEVREAVDYTLTHRTSAEPFDVVISGVTPGGDPARGAEITAAVAEAGATWWIECIDPWKFGWRWQGDWPLEAMHRRIRQGPPRQ